MRTSGIKGGKILATITPKEAEGFLIDVANLPDRWWHLLEGESISRAMKMLSKRHHGIFEPFRDKPLLLLSVMGAVRHFLRKAWDAKDARHRDWYLFEMRRSYRDLMIEAEGGPKNRVFEHPAHGDVPAITVTELDERLEEPPPITPIEAAISYLQTRIGDRAKHCNGPDCVAPYFIARKRWQKYCSEICAGPATRESKRRWWAENRAKNGGLS